MRIYIISCMTAENCVNVLVKRPVRWHVTYGAYMLNASYATVCRDTMEKLLKNTGKKLPKHGSKQIVVVDLKAFPIKKGKEKSS